MIGATLNGRYRVLGHLGMGRCGQTYLAQDNQGKGKPRCVIKQFEPLAKDTLSLRKAKYLFAREIKILKILGKSDRIPALLDYFEAGEKFYLVHEFIDGTDLTQELQSGQLWTETEVIALLREILEIVEIAHREKVIHQDIKPSNIIRRKTDGRLILIDFGSIKKIHNQMANAEGKTTQTIPIGTEGYRPPEQEGMKPKLASDIYAIGMMAIYALTGVEPQAIPLDPQTEEVKWRSLIQVDKKLAKILDRMVSPDFKQRYHSASEALKTIRNLKLDSKIQLLEPKNIIIISTLLLAILGAGYYYWQLESSLNQTPDINYSELDSTQVPFLFRHPNHGIEMKYPFSWKLQQTPQDWGIIAKFTPETSHSSLTTTEVTIRVDQTNINSLDQYTIETVDQITQLPQATIVDSAPIQLGEQAAHQIIYTKVNPENNLEIQYLQIWTLQGDRLYTMTYQAKSNEYDDFAATVENEMFKSINITPAKDR